MPIAAALLPEFDQEMTTTRKVLERVPSATGSWKPHPKSFAVGHLAQLVSWMPGWITNTLRETDLNLAAAAGYSFEPTEALLSGVVARMHLNHLIHHRGQLTVYLRLLDVPVPSVYGPTADEGW